MIPGSANPLLLTDAGYQIQRSLRLRSSASAYLSRTPSTTTNQNTFTYSTWIKLGNAISARFYTGRTGINFPAFVMSMGASGIAIEQYTAGGALQMQLISAALYRDISAWYHVTVVFNTTQATASDRVKLYVNGVQVTTFSTGSYPTQNLAINVSTPNTQIIGAETVNNSYLDCYLSEINFIDGQALTPSSFGEFSPVTGQWQAKKYSGTYGTNGFYLPFTDNSAATAAAIGADKSGNGNNWTPNNISVTAGVTYDSMLDVPLGAGGVELGNYATLNPLNKSSTASTSNSNLSLAQASALEVNQTTIGISTGKWYWETTVSSVGSSASPMIGVVLGGGLDGYLSSNGYYYFAADGKKFIGGTSTAYGATYTTNDVVGVALDMDAGTLTFYKNNVSQGVATTGLLGTFFAAFSNGGGPSPSWSAALNFGQRPFAYTPPAGFKALHTGNLPDPVIKQGNKYFDTLLYTGNGTTQSISNGNFQPDFAWIKARSSGTQTHKLSDSVRGIGYGLSTENTAAEIFNSAGLTSYDAGGFSVGSQPYYNTSASTYVAWLWKAGGAAVSNTAGSITSQVSAGVTQGMSVVTYTGTGANATVGHGLGVVPSFIIIKSRAASAANWIVTHNSMGNINPQTYLNINITAAKQIGDTAVMPGLITSSTFTVGSSVAVNGSGNGHVAYCFSEVAGFSKFGSYVGNGSADGPFVYCGFRPKLVMYKRTDTTGNWIIYDSSRSQYNQPAAALYPNLSNIEDVSHPSDFLSNGFKLRSTGADSNASGGTFIFAAFAELPFKYSLAR